MESNHPAHTHRSCWHCHVASLEFGLLLLLIGCFLIAKELGLTNLPFTFLSLVITGLGLILVIKSAGRG